MATKNSKLLFNFLLHVLYQLSYGIINAPGNYTNWTYECGPAFDVCHGEEINCPTNADCHIICSGNAGCYLATIHWPINGTGIISCDGPIHQSCQAVNFPIPPPNTDFTFECDTDHECSSATIYCPLNANCHIICNATGACSGATIYWSNNNTIPIISQLICAGPFPNDPCLNVNSPPTISPTFEPTYGPTSNPTYHPTFIPTKSPTNIPSFSPTLYPSINTSLLPTDDFSDDELYDARKGNLSVGVYVVIAIACVVVLIVCIAVIIKFRLNKNQSMMKAVSMHTITSPGTTTSTNGIYAKTTDEVVTSTTNDNVINNINVDDDDKEGDNDVNVDTISIGQTEGDNITLEAPAAYGNDDTVVGSDEFIVNADDESANENNYNGTTLGGTYGNDENNNVDGEELILRKDEEINRLRAQIQQLTKSKKSDVRTVHT